MKEKELKFNLLILFYIFIIASVFGWVIEGLWTLIKKGVIINHSAVVIGPFNMIYGVAAVLLTIILYKFKNSSKIKIFILSFIGCSILEYLMSYFMELIFGFTAWDYSKKILNINGRISLFYSLAWGILGIIWIKYCYPKIVNTLKKMNYRVGMNFAIFLTIFLLLDGILTINAMDRARKFELGIPPQNKYEEFLDQTFDSKYLTNMFNNNW